MRYQTNVFLDRSDISNLRTGKPIVIEQANGAPPIIIQAENPRQQQKEIPTKEGQFKCDECGKSFLKAQGLVMHMTRMGHKGHTNDTPELWCKKCDRTFKNKKALAVHKRYH